MKKICQTCDHWGWTDWDGPGDCHHPSGGNDPCPPTAYPTDSCDGWKEREDKSEDGHTDE